MVNFLEVERPVNGRRYAISDIHGCANTFKALVDQIKLSTNDHLYLIGDLINRGPKSYEVLDYVIELKSKGYQVFILMGNHEQIILHAANKSLALRKRIVQTYHSENLLDEAGNLKTAYKKLLEEAFHYLVLDDYYLVHAGFNFKEGVPFQDVQYMLNARSFKAKKKYIGERKIIIGHTPTDLSKIVQRIKSQKQKLCIDNGCVNFNSKEQGNLLCIDLDNYAIHLFRNIDQ